jgi:undecaprenyl pyrophosphate synthase
LEESAGDALRRQTPPVDLLQAIKEGGRIPANVAVIMDVNGRWARARGLPRFRGHSAGIK